jgi:hypothetical protein
MPVTAQVTATLLDKEFEKPQLHEIGVSSQTGCHRLNFNVIAMS